MKSIKTMDFFQGYKRVLLINCGAVLDLFEFLEPRDDMIIFVADTHRSLNDVLFVADTHRSLNDVCSCN